MKMFPVRLMVGFGALSVESSGATILASLPIIRRNQAKAKIRWVIILLPLSTIVQVLFFVTKSYFLDITIIFLLLLPLSICIGIGTVELKVIMFGKLKYKYVLEEVNLRLKYVKWAAIFIIDLLFWVVMLIPLMIFAPDENSIDLRGFVIVFGIIDVILGISVYIIFNKMFPKHNKRNIIS